MFTKTILLLSLTAIVFSNPAPQLTTDSAAATTTAFPSGDDALSSELASLSSIEGLYSGMPTLPASVESYIETAFPSTFTDACATTIPDYLATAPGFVKSALTSYEDAFSSWYAAHSTAFTVDTTYTGTTGTYLPTGSCGGGVKSMSAVTATGKTTATSKASGTTATGTATKGSGSTSTSTATGSAATSTGSSAASPRDGGFVMSFAGLFGVLGVMAAL